ncbi:hypothetical protein ACWCQW_09950 [Streptomyces mirabilis]
MNSLLDLQARLHALDMKEEEIHQQRAAVMRAYVQAAGGLGEAAALLRLHPTTVVQIQRLGEIAMVIYRNEGGGVDAEGRLFGETGGNDDTQRDADGPYWRVAKASRPKIRLLVIVVAGEVRRIWPVDPSDAWVEQPGGSGKVALPLGEHPLKPEEVRALYPDFGIAVGDQRPMRQGLLREYVPLDGGLS